MGTAAVDMLSKALKLPPDDRALLAQGLLASLGSPSAPHPGERRGGPMLTGGEPAKDGRAAEPATEPPPICSSPRILGGTVVFSGTRVPAQTLFDYLMDGCTLEEFLDNFPTVERRAALQLLKLGQATVLHAGGGA